MSDSTDKQPGDKSSTASSAPKVYRPEKPTDKPDEAATRPREIGGREGPEPVRYGDWEKNGRCIDF